jgi:hypothetical protein
MRSRNLCVATTCLAVALSGCSGSSPGESDEGNDAGPPDATVGDAAVDAKADRGIVTDAASDATVVADAGQDAAIEDASTQSEGASDAGSDSGTDGETSEAAAPIDAAGDSSEAGPEDAATDVADAGSEAGLEDAAIDAADADAASSSDAEPSDSATADGSVPSCLVAGTYTISSTMTTCSCGTIGTIPGVDMEFQIVPPGGLVENPNLGWVVVWLGPTSTITPPPDPTGSSPIVSTASGFSSSSPATVPVGCSGLTGGEETLDLTVDCETGIAALSASCFVNSPFGCPPGSAGTEDCGPFGATGGTSVYSFGITGSCTACVGP